MVNLQWIKLEQVINDYLCPLPLDCGHVMKWNSPYELPFSENANIIANRQWDFIIIFLKRLEWFFIIKFWSSLLSLKWTSLIDSVNQIEFKFLN